MLTPCPKLTCLSTGSPWSWYIATCGARRGDRRFDRLDLLAPEVAAFAGVRVQPAHGDPRSRETELADEIGGDNAQDFLEARACDRRRHRSERQVRRRQRDA